MRADQPAAASPLNPGFHFGIQQCCGKMGWNIEDDTPVKK
jgi:hypothetical protein